MQIHQHIKNDHRVNKHSIFLFKGNKPIVVDRELFYPIKYDKTKRKLRDNNKNASLNSSNIINNIRDK